MLVFDVLLLFLIAWALAFYRVRRAVWIAAFGLALFLFSDFSFPLSLSIPLWIIFLSIVSVTSIGFIRAVILTKPLRKLFKRQAMAMSQTEREAVDAGDVWWEKEIFSGRPKWDKLFATPAYKLSREEQSFLDNEVEELCSMLNDWEIVHTHHDLPKKAWNFIKKAGFWGMIIDKKYGGLGFSAKAHSAVVAKIATRSISAAVTVMVPNSLGPAELLEMYGTHDQRNYYLPRLAKGKEIPCFALTGEAGSDAGAMTDTGVVWQRKIRW